MMPRLELGDLCHSDVPQSFWNFMIEEPDPIYPKLSPRNQWRINRALERHGHRAVVRKRQRGDGYYLEFPNRSEMVAFQLRWS